MFLPAPIKISILLLIPPIVTTKSMPFSAALIDTRFLIRTGMVTGSRNSIPLLRQTDIKMGKRTTRFIPLTRFGANLDSISLRITDWKSVMPARRPTILSIPIFLWMLFMTILID